MALVMRHALQFAQERLLRVNKKIARLLTGDTSTQLIPFGVKLAQSYAQRWQDWEECPCVFVLSTGRVGTKTLTALFALSPQVISLHEPEPRLVKVSFDAYMEGGDLGASEKWQAVVLAARDDAICEANRRGKTYIETNNRLTYLAPALAAAFPASRFIHLHRHPYDVVRSAMRRGYYQSHNWDFARIRPRPGEPDAAGWDAMSPLEKSAWYWERCNKEAHTFLVTLPAARRMDLRADALFAGDEKMLKDLFDFVGMDFPPRNLVEEVLGQKINAARQGHFPPPSEWDDDERASVRQSVEATAKILGYEL